MANLLELLKNRGFSPRKISSRHGGEFCSPCPGPICKGAGEDRFHIWPYRENSGKCVGRFWCRQCDVSGDTMAFLQQVDGLTFPAAYAELGIAIEAKQSQRRSRYQPPPAPLPNQEQAWQPRSYPEPGAVWQEKAANLLADCQSRLLSTPEALSWLTARGIDAATAKAYGLGYNLSSKGKVSIHAPVRGATITRQHAVFPQLKAYNSRKANKGLDYHLLGHPFFSFS